MIDTSPLVTVIIPCYNHEDFVDGALRSVIDQTYRNIQIVAIDDGSRDGSVAILNALAGQYGFALIVQENRGVCRTLNRAIREAAHGEWIALLASDDLWHPRKIELQMQALAASTGARFCFSQAVEFKDSRHPDQGRVFPGRVKTGAVLESVFLRQHVPAGTMLFARSLYDELGGFDESLKEEDWDFVIRSAAATEFVAVDKPLLFYRAHAGNTMRTRARAATFRQKAILLSKNMTLVSPWRWLAAILIHFSHDIILATLRSWPERWRGQS